MNTTIETITETKELIAFLNGLDLDFDKEEKSEVLEKINEGDEDFEVNNYRFILQSSIDQIQQDELSSDEYILGCFTDWFISDITGLEIQTVNALQKAEQYEELGRLMLPHIETVQSDYVSSDGYGHHFGHYDGNENEFGEYLVFRVN